MRPRDDHDVGELRLGEEEAVPQELLEELARLIDGVVQLVDEEDWSPRRRRSAEDLRQRHRRCFSFSAEDVGEVGEALVEVVFVTELPAPHEAGGLMWRAYYL